jgi:hypothetical protein
MSTEKRVGTLTPTFADAKQVRRAWLANVHAVGRVERRWVHLIGPWTCLAPPPRPR